MATGVQFDASFAKAMRLLQSPDPNAATQLKAILDECLAQKKTPATVAMPKPQPPPPVKPVVANKAPALQVPPPKIIAPPSDDINYDTSLSCIVCKRSDVRTGNEIVECQDCHSLYHQECHDPSLVDENVKDPRFIWYCSSCRSKRKKAKLPSKQTVALSGNGSTSKETKDQNNPPEQSPFKSWSFVKK